jgi:hypothetical protein
VGSDRVVCFFFCCCGKGKAKGGIKLRTRTGSRFVLAVLVLAVANCRDCVMRELAMHKAGMQTCARGGNSGVNGADC